MPQVRGMPRNCRTETVGTTPGDATLAVDAFEVSDKQHAKVHARRYTLATAHVVALVDMVGTVSSTQRSKSGFVQQSIEPLIKRVARRLPQMIGRHEQRIWPWPPFPHPHRSSLPVLRDGTTIFALDFTTPVKQYFFNGLLRTPAMFGMVDSPLRVCRELCLFYRNVMQQQEVSGMELRCSQIEETIYSLL